ncbi:DUF6192 family protein [Streptomyces sp. RKAG293]|uniref:DUF6192 family protein n=1 Tax=Streptomyces sp. RKAG293 TaxID=2893403 RepID=UPI002033BF76|nr:DUF6192 family protein [Streptomyces sp. RKAG293]MCM2416554.1 DUF6192 family protein [Streptomyces sp. RKAG293]
MPEESAEKVGSVSASRYAEILTELRKLMETASRIQFTIGDAALEVEPMRGRGGSAPGAELFTVRDSLFRLAEDIGATYRSVESARWASRWPKDRRVKDVSFTVHKILASIADEQERFTAILNTPEGKARWTPDDALRRVGQQVARPVTPQEKVSAIHTLAQDEEVAATVTGDLLRRPSVVAQVKVEDKVRAVAELTREDQVAAAVAPDFLRRPAVVAQVAPADKVRVVEELTRDEGVAAEVTTGLLRRPDVAFRAMSDDIARHQVNRAQVDPGWQAREHFQDTNPVAPAIIRSIERSVEFLDLVTACHAFVAAAGRVVPGMRDRQLDDDERTIVHENVARVRATLDWIETVVDTGKVDVDGKLARLLQGE